MELSKNPWDNTFRYTSNARLEKDEILNDVNVFNYSGIIFH